MWFVQQAPVDWLTEWPQVLPPSLHAQYIESGETMCASAFFHQAFVFYAWPPRVPQSKCS